MNVSIRNRIYGSFAVLVLIFVVNGIATVVTLDNNTKASGIISDVINPALQNTGNLEDLLIESKIRTTNWVFLRSAQEDKSALKKLQDIDYPALKEQLIPLFSKLENGQMTDSLNKICNGFDQLILTEKKVMISLQKPEDFNDPVKRPDAERVVKDEVLPRTALLIKAVDVVISYLQDMINEKNTALSESLRKLKILITVFAVTIIFLGIFLSMYMARKIINPLNKIRHIVNDLGKGIIKKANHKKINRDEIGEMLRSVNNLSEKLQGTAAFAAEIGKRNFNAHFEPLSSGDTLGIALLAMRDNIKLSDEKINQVQHIAHLGSLERDIATGDIYLSDEMFNILGIDPASFDYDFQNVLKLIHPECRGEFKTYREKYLQGIQPDDFECRIITPVGITKNVIVQTKVIAGASGKISRIVGIVQDITERKRGEEKLAEERELFRLVIENIPDQIYLKDTHGRFKLCNLPVALNAGRTSQAEMIGKTDFDFLPGETAKQCFEEEQLIIKSGIPLINHEEHMQDKVTGQLRWSLSTKFPVRNNTGDMIGLIGINHDITGRKIAQEKLEVVNRELSILFNSIDEIFFSVNMITLKVIQISATCENLYGYKQAEFLADYTLWFDIIHPDDKHVIKNEDDILKKGEQINNHYRIIRKDKSIRWVETKITPTLNQQGNLIRVDGVTRDITERIEAEKELNKSEERYRQIVETAQEGIWMMDENSNTTFINKKLCEIIDYLPEEIIGKKMYEFMDQDAREKAPARIQKRMQGISEMHDSKFITKSGRSVWTSLSVNPVFDDSGTYKGALAMITDITQRKHDEQLLQKSQVSLVLNNLELERKNKELEQFAYVASHDLQEPLRTTISFVEIFKKQYFEKIDPAADKYLTYIVQATDRMRVLIKDLLDFSRIGSEKVMEQVDCNKILEDVIADVRIAIKDSKAQIEAEHLPVINGYPTELKQLFQNLLINSIKFRKKNIPLKINIAAQKKSDHWLFSFTDNGIGIDRQHNERIFIIFQRLHTRSEYQGSGIGLSHCKKIVELHHGKIWVESTPGEGSTFYFSIHLPKEKIHESKIELHNAG